MKRLILSAGSFGFGSTGFVFLALGLLIGTESSTMAEPGTTKFGGDCATTSAACTAGTCTTAATDCISPVGTCKCT